MGAEGSVRRSVDGRAEGDHHVVAGRELERRAGVERRDLAVEAQEAVLLRDRARVVAVGARLQDPPARQGGGSPPDVGQIALLVRDLLVGHREHGVRPVLTVDGHDAGRDHLDHRQRLHGHLDLLAVPRREGADVQLAVVDLVVDDVGLDDDGVVAGLHREGEGPVLGHLVGGARPGSHLDRVRLQVLHGAGQVDRDGGPGGVVRQRRRGGEGGKGDQKGEKLGLHGVLHVVQLTIPLRVAPLYYIIGVLSTPEHHIDMVLNIVKMRHKMTRLRKDLTGFYRSYTMPPRLGIV